MIQYPADTFILAISSLLRDASGFIGILAIVSATGTLGGWRLYEILLMFSMCALIESICQTFFDNVWGIHVLVHQGKMDVLLVRPAPVFFQLLGDVMHYPALVSVITYISIMIYAIAHLEIGFSAKLLLLLTEYLLCGLVINTGIYTIFNSLNFWIIQGEDVAILVQTCREFAKYPMNLFPYIVRFVFTYILPFGFVGYYPAAYLIGKTDDWILAGLPLTAIMISILASVFWRLGLSGYSGTGS